MPQIWIKTVVEECGKERIQTIHYHPENLSQEVLDTGYLIDASLLFAPDSSKSELFRPVRYFDKEQMKPVIEYFARAETKSIADLEDQVTILKSELKVLGKTDEEITNMLNKE